MIKAIIFDLGGVVFTNGTKKFIEIVSTRYNLDKEVVKDVVDGEIGSNYRESKISRDGFWKQVLEKLNIKEDSNKLEQEWINGYELIEGTKEIILTLAKKYKVYYLSDNVRERVEKIDQRYKFIEWFEDGIFSHEVGVRKPSPEIYQLALQKAKVKPKEAIYIDDKAPFLVPAARIGMKTILFEASDKLTEELEKLGVKV